MNLKLVFQLLTKLSCNCLGTNTFFAQVAFLITLFLQLNLSYGLVNELSAYRGGEYAVITCDEETSNHQIGFIELQTQSGVYVNLRGNLQVTSMAHPNARSFFRALHFELNEIIDKFEDRLAYDCGFRSDARIGHWNIPEKKYCINKEFESFKLLTRVKPHSKLLERLNSVEELWDLKMFTNKAMNIEDSAELREYILKPFQGSFELVRDFTPYHEIYIEQLKIVSQSYNDLELPNDNMDGLWGLITVEGYEFEKTCFNQFQLVPITEFSDDLVFPYTENVALLENLNKSLPESRNISRAVRLDEDTQPIIESYCELAASTYFACGNEDPLYQ